MVTTDDRAALETLEQRIATLLPEAYQDRYDTVQPVSMGSAALKYDPDGRVAWNQMWATFCDLAMAGGPPHRGRLLEPPQSRDIDAHPADYERVILELCRGLEMTTELYVEPSPARGWVRLTCTSEGMAQWMLRAIVVENVSARAYGISLDLPAAPGFRLEKEIKNVITAAAKTSHYWLGHTSAARRQAVRDLLAGLAATSPVVAPDPLIEDLASDPPAGAARTMNGIHRRSPLTPATLLYRGWFGVQCPSVRAAIWMMRALVASNVLSRREDTTLFVPLNPTLDPDGDTVAAALALVHRLAAIKGVL